MAISNVWKFGGGFVLLVLIIYGYKYQSYQKPTDQQFGGKDLKHVDEKTTKKKVLVNTTSKSNVTPKNIVTLKENVSTSNKVTINQVTKAYKEKDKKALLKQFFNTQRKKVIMTHTKVFGDVFWWDVEANFKFVEHDGTPCEVSHCQVVYERKYVKTADALLFHAADLPPVKEIKSLVTPLKQVWIWMSQESPLHYQNEKISFKDYDGVFNWTGTYRTDSTIWTPYRVIVPLKNTDRKPDKNKNYAQGKKKMIIAIISNNCKSYRIEFIRKLKKYIDVDLYGACKGEVNTELPECPFGRKCEEIQSHYKFYLSLENAFCTGYVTEKFHVNALKRGSVPIVLNRGNFTNTRVAPPNSFINVLDFKDLPALAKYLKELASNDKDYNKFHAWRQDYKVTTQNRMCTVCKELWKREIQRNNDHKTVNLSNYWSFKNNCISYDDNQFQKYLK